MVFKRVPRWIIILIVTLGQQYNIGEKKPLYCTLTLISMQGHQKHKIIFICLGVPDYTVVVVIWSYMVLEKLNKLY